MYPISLVFVSGGVYILLIKIPGILSEVVHMSRVVLPLLKS